MDFSILIPARLASTRLPDKPLADIAGKPMVVRVAERVAAADVVVTGEGRLDGQSSFGKATQHIAALARSAGRPVLCVAGALGPGHERMTGAFDAIEALAAAEPAQLPSRDEAARQLGEATVRGLLGLVGRQV